MNAERIFEEGLMAGCGKLQSKNRNNLALAKQGDRSSSYEVMIIVAWPTVVYPLQASH